MIRDKRAPKTTAVNPDERDAVDIFAGGGSSVLPSRGVI